MFASYKKNALIGRVLSAEAKTEAGGRREVYDEGIPPALRAVLRSRGETHGKNR